MSATHRRAARRELEAAKVLGAKRVRRPNYGVSAPDVEPVRLASGEVLSVEVKTRKRLPTVISAALAQAERYGMPTAIPVGVISQTGGRAIAVLDLRHLARLLGIAPPESVPQPALPFGVAATPAEGGSK